MSLCLERFEHFKQLDLADYSNGQDSLQIDVLIGADYYWELVTGIRADVKMVLLLYTPDLDKYFMDLYPRWSSPRAQQASWPTPYSWAQLWMRGDTLSSWRTNDTWSVVVHGNRSSCFWRQWSWLSGKKYLAHKEAHCEPCWKDLWPTRLPVSSCDCVSLSLNGTSHS